MIKSPCILLFLGLMISATSAFPQNKPSHIPYANDWVAVDGAGRSLPTFAEVGDHKNDRYIGVFYWLWHAYIRTSPIRNMTEELRRTNGNPQFIPQDWYWAEPENGYYHNSDPWVTRRNLQMLANAGVDFIYLDYTNGHQGSESFDEFMSLALDMYNKGIPVPKVVFFLNDVKDPDPTKSRHVIDFIYKTVYKPGKYKDLWFYWDGKPLIMEGKSMATSTEIANFFTFRDTWAFQESTTDQWRFIDNYPQRASYHNGVPEQIVVNKSMGAPLLSTGAVNDKGSSYTSKQGPPEYNAVWETERTPYGDYFEEQWTRAHEVSPPIICVTGWNEWTAGQWESNEPALEFMGQPVNEIGFYMVDQFNIEFNRDMEPMKGGYTDNYYYQLVSHIRKYKGLTNPQGTSPNKTIVFDDDFGDWADVTPVYKDAPGDTQHRNFKNVDNSGIYINTTGRNDIVESRVTSDENNVYFYTKTLAPLTAWDSPNWMFLFIDADKDKSTGWEGYDYVVNYGVNSASETTIKKWENSEWKQIGTCVLNVLSNELEIAVPKFMIEAGDAADLYFHWADNMQKINDITEFFINGDSAPDRRFNYAYSAVSTAGSQTPYNGIINLPGIIEAENFDKGGEGISVHDAEAANLGGQYRPTEPVDIQSDGEGYYVGWTVAGEWMEYSVNVSISGSYTLDARVASSADNASFHLEMDGLNVTERIGVPDTGGPEEWQTISKVIQLTAGQHVMRFVVDEGGFNIDKFSFTPVKNEIISGGIYKVVSKNSGKCMEVADGSTDIGAKIQQWTYLGGAHQHWKIEEVGGEYYKMVAMHSGKVLDVKESLTTDGAITHQWDWLDANNQKFKFADAGEGYYSIIAQHSDKYLGIAEMSIENGAQVQLGEPSDEAGQQWKLELVEIPPLGIFDGKDSALKSTLLLFPNPADQSLNIKWDNPGKKEVILTIVNFQGMITFQETLKGVDAHQIKTSDFAPGVYVLQLKSKNSVETKKILINR